MPDEVLFQLASIHARSLRKTEAVYHQLLGLHHPRMFKPPAETVCKLAYSNVPQI